MTNKEFVRQLELKLMGNAQRIIDLENEVHRLNSIIKQYKTTEKLT